jgi:hypothetical protein
VATVGVRLRFPNIELSDVPSHLERTIRTAFAALNSGVDDTTLISVLPGSVVVQTETIFTSTGGAREFVAQLNCCSTDLFNRTFHHEMGGPPEMLAIRTTSLVAPPSSADQPWSRGDTAGDDGPEKLWVLGLIAAAVVLVGAGCVLAAYYRFYAHDPQTPLQLEYSEPLNLEVGSPSPFKRAVHPEALLAVRLVYDASMQPACALILVAHALTGCVPHRRSWARQTTRPKRAIFNGSCDLGRGRKLAW